MYKKTYSRNTPRAGHRAGFFAARAQDVTLGLQRAMRKPAGQAKRESFALAFLGTILLTQPMVGKSLVNFVVLTSEAFFRRLRLCP
jgi:hypothetical protein